MGMTMTQKILANHAGLNEVNPGQLIKAKTDCVMGNDITAPVAINEFEKAKFDKVFDPSKIVFVLDHFVPNKDIKSAENCKQIRNFSKQYENINLFDVGRMGIEHALLPEKGFVAPGELIIGADSHTCTYGALGAFSTGVGSTDLAAAMATGTTWFKVPQAIKVILTGVPSEFVCGKDIILYLISKLGVDGANYKSLEFFGNGIKNLSIDDRFTICNMAIECGAKNAIFPVDDIVLDYLKGKIHRGFRAVSPDEDASYEQTIEINLASLRPCVAFPHSPENVHSIDDIEKIEIDQVVIGSCTNGRISDMRIAAQILKGRRVAQNVRTIIIPATQKIYLQCIHEGLAEIFINAGAIFSTPTCGPCLGGHMGILASGEKAVSTTNRNFVGRMGHVESEVYLSSPAIAAASAIKGYIANPENI